jgi:hypothetical protein
MLARHGRMAGMSEELSKDQLDELREKAREHIADLPAETALGNADPEAPHTETPAEWEAEHQGPAS